MKKFVVTNRCVSALLVLILFTINSCKKGDQELHFDGDFGIKINMQGLESNSVQNGKVAKKSSSIARTETSAINAQQVVIPFGDDLMLKATLKPDIDVDAVMAAYASSTNKNGGKKAAVTRAASASDELASNIAYRVLAYNSSGSLVGSRVYQYKGLDLVDDDLNTGYENLVIGETYTFVVYSVNTTATGDLTGTILNENNLSAATISADNTKDLLFYKEVVELKNGVNYLNVRLKHQFSQITAVLSVDESTADLVGTRIYGINQVTVLPSYGNGLLKFSDGSFTVQNEITNGSEITFPTIGASGVNLLTSSPVRIISNGDDATFSIGTLSINDITNSLNLTHFGTGGSQEAFTIQPGVRYTLQLEVAAPCTETVLLDNPEINASGGVDADYDILNADYGTEIDIYNLDNSFNMKINGLPLYIGSTEDGQGNIEVINEIQFQGFAKGADARYYPNIEFADGDRWEVGSITDIWNMHGTADRPILRVVISRNGIAMYGSKSNGGGEPFYPLRLLNEEEVTTSQGTRTIRGSFNENIVWNEAPGTTNLVEISQQVISTTVFNGYIRGTRTIPCTP